MRRQGSAARLNTFGEIQRGTPAWIAWQPVKSREQLNVSKRASGNFEDVCSTDTYVNSNVLIGFAILVVSSSLRAARDGGFPPSNGAGILVADTAAC